MAEEKDGLDTKLKEGVKSGSGQGSLVIKYVHRSVSSGKIGRTITGSFQTNSKLGTVLKYTRGPLRRVDRRVKTEERTP